jgi:uncharacterized protein YegP (UPF0339 family)
VPARFVLKKGSTGKFRFNLVATNGQVVATSEAYETKRAALGGINSVKKHAEGAEIDDQTAGGNGQVKARSSKATRSRDDKPKATEAAASREEKSKEPESGKKQKTPPQGETETPDADREMQLGLCHYGGEGEPATAMAVRKEGTGWIAVCDDHRKDAENDGFRVDDKKR